MDQRLQHETWNSETARGKHRQCLRDMGVGKDFLNRISFAQELKASIDKWGSIKLKSFHTTKAKLTAGRDFPLSVGNGKEYFSAIRLTEDLHREYIKSSKTQNQKNDLFQKWSWNLNREFLKEKQKVMVRLEGWLMG